MGRMEDVTLLCEPEEWGGRRRKDSRRFLSMLSLRVLLAAIITVLLILVIVLLTKSGTETKYEDREHSSVDPLDPQHLARRHRRRVVVAGMQTTTATTTTTEEPQQVVVTTERSGGGGGGGGQDEDPLEYEDELAALLESVGPEPEDPDAVAFLLPLRGDGSDLGLSLGRSLKERLEAREDTWGEQQLPPAISTNTSSFLPNAVLVRDTQTNPIVSRKLTQHFYEMHGTKRYFGYLTDAEALTVAHWARSYAPGTRFVTPTATSIYLEGVKNLGRVQPSIRPLTVAVADLLSLVSAKQALVVARASLHTDAFILLLRNAGFKPTKIMHYYGTTNLTKLANRIRGKLAEAPSPVLLLGDSESWDLVQVADQLFPAVWILPLPTQTKIKMRTNQSEVVAFHYRAYDDEPGKFLREEPMLSPHESLVAASRWLLSGKERKWYGSYVVAANVAVGSVTAGVRLVGVNADGWLPLIQYDLRPNTLMRRLYQELLVTQELLSPLVSAKGCTVILRYLEELSGERRVRELPVHSSLPTLLVPAERGAQVHVDCPTQHADLRCFAPPGQWGPVKCQGSLQGHHKFIQKCGREVGIRMAASRGCTGARGLVCRGGRSLGCLLSGLCTSLRQPPPPLYLCDDLRLDKLTLPL